MTKFDSHRRASAASARVAAGYAVALVLMLAGCSGDAAVDASGADASATRAPGASGVKFDLSLAQAACKVVTADTVAATFGLPVHEIEQTERSNMCSYRWKSGDQRMETTIHVTRVSKNATEAAEHFANVTRGLSGAELDRAMANIRDSAREMGAEGAAADAVLGATGNAVRSPSRGLEFSDVPGIGDQARMRVGSGDINVLHGNLHFSLSAEHGPRMPAPADLNELVAASRAWQEATLPQRQEQAISLARAAVAALPR